MRRQNDFQMPVAGQMDIWVMTFGFRQIANAVSQVEGSEETRAVEPPGDVFAVVAQFPAGQFFDLACSGVGVDGGHAPFAALAFRLSQLLAVEDFCHVDCFRWKERMGEDEAGRRNGQYTESSVTPIYYRGEYFHRGFCSQPAARAVDLNG